ncbi:GTP pyrophosphokinase [Caldithrix abyssi]
MKVFEIIAEYQNRYPLNKEFSEKLKLLFERLLIAHNISFLQIETRVKSLPSFLDKVYRVLSAGKEFSYNCTDLVGIRLITYYLEDVYQIGELIEQTFKVHYKNLEYDSLNRSPDQFGYSSLHFKVSLSPEYNYPLDVQKFKNNVFEIQIRTVAQHAWATIDHKLRYKTTEKIPKLILRQIFQLSALFELADIQFSNIKKQLEAQASDDLKRYQAGDLSAKINALTLGYFLKTHQTTIDVLVKEAKKIGFNETSIQQDPNTIRYLLILFKRLGIESMAELEQLFDEALQKKEIILKNIYRIISNSSYAPIDYPFPVILLILITLRLKIIDFDAIDVQEIILKLMGNPEASLDVPPADQAVPIQQ